MPALIDDDLVLFGGRGDWETDPQLSMDAQGFDSVKATVCFKGTSPELFDLYALGSQNAPDFAGRPLFYCGPRVLEARFGYQIAELEWKGFASDPWPSPPVSQLGANAYVRTVNITMTTDESLWPRESNGHTLYLGPPYSPNTPFSGSPGLRTFTALAPNGNTIITAQLPWRIRLIGRAWAILMSGIIAGPRSVIVLPPRCIVPDPGVTSGNNINWLSTGDPLVTWAQETQGHDGWVCRNYDLSSEMPLGDKTLSKWSAHYQWVDRYGP